MTDSIKRRRWLPLQAAAAILLATPALHAAPVSVAISGISITWGSGYGVDSGANGENGGQNLAVDFTSAFVPQSFPLAHVGDSFSFDLLTVAFNEPDTGSPGNLGIRNGEQDNLGVTVSLTFTGPSSTVTQLIANGTATLGPIGDAAVDYAIDWDPVQADFGADGKFQISVNSLSFTNNGTQTARATVELLSAPELRVANVPEPTSLALAGVALAGAGAVRRRRPR